jgi:hypothetical protein
MAASRSTAKPTEVVPTEAEPVDGVAAGADPALAAPDSSPNEQSVAEQPVAEQPVHELVVPEQSVPSDGAPLLDHPVVAEPVIADPVVDEAPAIASAEPAEPLAVQPPIESVISPPAHQVVYVEAPRPFVRKGNRGFGVLIAIVSTIIFAALYAVAEILTDLVNGVPASFTFVSSADFWAPVVFFAVGFIVLVLIVNRAGWAAHVLGSLFVGLFVYFGGSAAYLLLHASEIPSNQVASTYSHLLFSVGAILAALIAREVSLWMGAAIAARGRRVKARNVEARVLYDQEIAAKRAEYERANSTNVPAARVASDQQDEVVAP